MKELFKTIARGSKIAAARLSIIDPFRNIFPEIEFETTAYCNRKCDYCPNVDHERLGAKNSFFMPDEVFKTLINQLVDLNFEGQVAPHLYGEPMSDPRLVDWVTHIRQELPQSKIKIVTNGDFLGKKRYLDLRNAGVDVFYISKHGEHLHKKCKTLLEELDEAEKIKHIVFQDFFTDFENEQKMFTNRGGDIKLDEKQKKKPPVNCVYAAYPVINTYGDLILCCQDFHNKYIFGNIMEKHLRDIWHDHNNLELRRRIFKSDFDLEICQNCAM